MNDGGLLVNPDFDSNTIIDPERLEAAGFVADQLAADAVFADYTSRKAHNTLRSQRADLDKFATFLENIGVDGYDAVTLQNLPSAWSGVSWGLVEGFVKWQLKEGYAIASVNRALSTVKTYSKLAAKASVIDPQALALIKTVSGYGQKEGKRIDERREVVRIGWKKSQHNAITSDQAAWLKESHSDTPQGCRDRFMFCLLLDHGLRVSEVKLLEVENCSVRDKEMRFYRPKVSRTQTHRFTDDTLDALRRYRPHAPQSGRILRGSRKDGSLHGLMSETAITLRVAHFGRMLGIQQLSAHDCRHYWATAAARNGTPLERLMDAGGWSSLTMPLRYIEAASIANEGVKLKAEKAISNDDIELVDLREQNLLTIQDAGNS